MAVEKYKPKSTPRTWELRAESLHERSAEIIRTTRVLLQQSRELIERSRELVEETDKNHSKKKRSD
jgi:hypothetical protein